ncbi:MAG TPA: hypothetical protein VK034_26350, partial [Enhygromyxa sp.]|nr:hypothetical protein [Enhygromyxa sp.]
RLPDLGFGTAADGDGESGIASTEPSADSGDGDPAITTSSSGESADEEPSGDGDDPSTSTSTSTTGDGDGDGDADGDGDGDADGDPDDEAETNESDDTWGIPPDVTNEPCEPLAQDCYPTHKCVPYSTQPNSPLFDANKCMPIIGDKQWGEPCTLSSFQEAQDECDGQGFCWNLKWMQGQLHGTCVPFCFGTPQNLVCPLGWGCMFSGAVALCGHKCDPLLQDCSGEQGCYWNGQNFQCASISNPGMGSQQSCDEVNECLPGLGCVDKALVPGCVGPDDSCCTPWCSLQAPDCPDSLECVPFFDGEVPDLLADVGVCLP